MSTTPLESPQVSHHHSPLTHPNTTSSPSSAPPQDPAPDALPDADHLHDQHMPRTLLDPNHPATAAAMAHLLMQAQMSSAANPDTAFAAISAQLQAMSAIHQHFQQQQPSDSQFNDFNQQNLNNTASPTNNKPEPGSQEWIKQRRESHKEVERRRREVINTGINELAKIVPNCSDRNKGGILHRAVQYIQQLKEAEQRNAERWTLDKMLADQAINDLTGYVEYLKSENEVLRNQISDLGGHVPPRAQPPAPSVPSYHAMAAAMHPNAYPSYHHFFNAPTPTNAQQLMPPASNEPWSDALSHASMTPMTPEMAASIQQAHAHMAAAAAANNADELPVQGELVENDGTPGTTKRALADPDAPAAKRTRINHPSQYTADNGVHSPLVSDHSPTPSILVEDVDPESAVPLNDPESGVSS